MKFPTIESWVGYEAVKRDYWAGRIDFDEMNKQVGDLEQLNTDWFGLLGQNSFSHKHTLSVSGGGDNVSYYASIGYNDARGTSKRESNESYMANMNVTANFNRFSIRAGMDASVQEKNYLPSGVE